jgi:hypothetical protein
MVIYLQSHVEHTNAFCDKTQHFLQLQQFTHIVTTGIWQLNLRQTIDNNGHNSGVMIQRLSKSFSSQLTFRTRDLASLR